MRKSAVDKQACEYEKDYVEGQIETEQKPIKRHAKSRFQTDNIPHVRKGIDFGLDFCIA